jgi:hypothetical protein
MPQCKKIMFCHYPGGSWWATKTLCTQNEANAFSLWNNNLGYQGILESFTICWSKLVWRVKNPNIFFFILGVSLAWGDLPPLKASLSYNVGKPRPAMNEMKHANHQHSSQYRLDVSRSACVKCLTEWWNITCRHGRLLNATIQHCDHTHRSWLSSHTATSLLELNIIDHDDILVFLPWLHLFRLFEYMQWHTVTCWINCPNICPIGSSFTARIWGIYNNFQNLVKN